MKIFTKRNFFYIAILLSFFSASLLKAENVTVQYFLGGVDGVPADSVGVLIADRDGDGFDLIYKAGVGDLTLAVGETLAGSDDVIIGVTEATTSEFTGGQGGFADTFASIDYAALGLESGDPIRFFWFPTVGSGNPVLAADIAFESFENANPDTGGDASYVLPAGPGVYTLTHLDANAGGAANIVPATGMAGPIATQPMGGEYESGENASLMVGTQGDGPFAYQWYRGQQGSTSNPVGTDSPMLDIVPSYNAEYWVRVTDDSGFVDSIAAAVTVEGGGVRPELTWDAVSGAEYYHLWISKDGRTWKTIWIEGESSTSWTSETDMPAGNYQWWIAAWTSAGGTQSYVLQTPFSLGLIDLIAPEGTLPDGETRPEFSWTPSPGATWYYLHITKGGALWKGQWIEGADTLTWQSSSAMPAGNYVWRVAPWSGTDGRGPYSQSKSFTMGLPEPLLPSGLQDSTSGSTEFTWTGSSSNEWYQVHLTRNGVVWFAQWLQGSDTTSYLSPSQLPSGNYRWKVRGYSAAGGSTEWSATVDFEIEGTVQLNPSGLITGNPKPLFEWTAEPGADQYRLYITKGGSLYYNQWLVGATSWVPETDLSEGSYRWWVRPWGAQNGYSSWTPGMDFEYSASASASAPAPSASVAPTGLADFNGDNVGDLVVQDSTTGETSLVYLSGDLLAGSDLLSIQPGSGDWKVISHGDIDGDMENDLLWLNSGTGEVLGWTLAGDGSVTGSLSLGVDPAATGQIPLALSDFDGDGYSDLVVEDSASGELAVWFLRDFEVQSTASIVNGQTGDWEYAASVDIDSDGTLDIVWQNSVTGGVMINSVTVDGAVSVGGESVTGFPSLNGQSVVAVQDVDGNDEADLILQSSDTGELVVWYVSGGSFQSESTMGFQPGNVNLQVRNHSRR